MSVLDNIREETIRRYSDRYRSFGKDIKTLGWGSVEQQHIRFSESIKQIGLSGKNILDIGCGFGDLKIFLDEKNVKYSSYTGWDINRDLIAKCNQIHFSNNSSFEVVDLSRHSGMTEDYDVVVMLGLLNFNLKDTMDNYEYSQMMMEKAFALCSEVAVIDFLSTNICEGYPKEDFVFYHDPKQILDIAFTLTPNIVLNHSYVPIPQKEFILFLSK
jgi:SAM-dependent methyltransferase